MPRDILEELQNAMDALRLGLDSRWDAEERDNLIFMLGMYRKACCSTTTTESTLKEAAAFLDRLFGG